MDVQTIQKYIDSYPCHVVIFEGNRAYGAFNENAEVLRHSLYCRLFKTDDYFYASFDSLETIENTFNNKQVSYVVVLRDGTILKETSYRSNSYLKLLNKYNRNWIPPDEEQSIDGVDCSEHIKLIKGKVFYGAAGEEAFLLNNILECEMAVNSMGTCFAFNDLEKIETALSENQVSFYITEDNTVKKKVSFFSNRYIDFLPQPDVPEEIPYEKPPEAITFEPLSDDDVVEITSVRNIYFTPKFKRYYEKAKPHIKEKIDLILDSFRNLKEEELWDYLKQKNNKPLRGSKHDFDKLYVDNSSGHRLVWCRADDLLLDAKGDEIVIIAYVEDHDQQGLAADSFDPDAELLLAFKESDDLQMDALEDFEDDIPPFLFYKNRFIPQLNGTQKNQALLEPPLMLQGCAGSGKTQVSVEIFERLLTVGQNPTYVTFTRDLVEEIREKLRFTPELEGYTVLDSILTVTDFFLKLLGLRKRDLKQIEINTFKKWKRERYLHNSDNKYKKLDADYTWTYLRGVIKGGAISEDVPDRSTFTNWMKNEGLDESESDLLYNIFEDYEVNRKDSDLLDDNDIAKLILSNDEIKNSVDSIIVDEVQDLTYTQIKALLHCVKDFNIYLCGDINQRINPTIIDLDAVNRLFYYHGQSILKVEKMGSSFRSGKGLIAFLNHLSDLRREYIAFQDRSVETPESSLRKEDEGLWATICNRDAVDLRSVCAIAAEAANCIVIVPNDEVQESLIDENSSLENRVKTVQQMKGLEYDNVIIYDFLSYYREVFKEIFRRERKRDTYGRLLFNLLYVACTRARDRLIICESECDKEIERLVYKDITEKDSIENVRGFMQLEVDDDGWLKEAKRLEQMNKFDMAKSAYQMIESNDYVHDIRKCDLMDQCNKAMQEADEDFIILTLEENAASLLDMGEYDYANRLYNILNTDYEMVYINALYTMALTDQTIPSSYVTRVLDEENESVLEKDIEKILPYMDKRIQKNYNKVGLIKGIGEVIRNGR